MKASEIRDMLEKLIYEYGDLDVFVFDDEWGVECPIIDIKRTKYDHSTKEIFLIEN